MKQSRRIHQGRGATVVAAVGLRCSSQVACADSTGRALLSRTHHRKPWSFVWTVLVAFSYLE